MMKTILLTFAAILALSLNLPAQERINAYDALRAAQENVRPQVKDSVLGMQSKSGNPNPKMWEVVFYDSIEKDRKLILEMEGTEVKKQNRPLEFFSKLSEKNAIDLNKLRLNSDKAYKMVEEIAKTENQLMISRADFILTKIKPEDPESNPIWIINVYDAQNHHLGEVTISAFTGNVLRTKKLKYQGKRDATFTEKVGSTFEGIGKGMEEFFTGGSSSSEKKK